MGAMVAAGVGHRGAPGTGPALAFTGVLVLVETVGMVGHARLWTPALLDGAPDDGEPTPRMSRFTVTNPSVAEMLSVDDPPTAREIRRQRGDDPEFEERWRWSLELHAGDQRCWFTLVEHDVPSSAIAGDR